jgi:hypothetical protein
MIAAGLPAPVADPVPADGAYSIIDGRVRTRSLEVHIVDHCNLRCASCCSLSPLLPKWCIDPADLERDLRLAKGGLAPTWFKLVGGEPLLHPQIDDCLAIARRSGIAEIVSVTTNGHLLPRTSDRFWQLADALTISLYPEPALAPDVMAWIENRASEHGVRLNWKRQDQFVQMDRPIPHTDPDRLREIYDVCWLRRRCHIVSNSRFYMCTRPPHFQTLLGESFHDDGLALHAGPSLAEELLAYLQRERPLKACERCEGGRAPLAPHHQMDRQELQAARQQWMA